MAEWIPKSVILVAAALSLPALMYVAYSRRWYFTSQSYPIGLIFLEFLLAAAWMYRRVFFPVVLVTFLLAGVNLTAGRGLDPLSVLGVGMLGWSTTLNGSDSSEERSQFSSSSALTSENWNSHLSPRWDPKAAQPDVSRNVATP